MYLCFQDNARIVGLTVDVDDGIVFWSDVSFANSGIYRGDIGAGGTLQNVKKIVSGKLRLHLVNEETVKIYSVQLLPKCRK